MMGVEQVRQSFTFVRKMNPPLLSVTKFGTYILLIKLDNFLCYSQ